MISFALSALRVREADEIVSEFGNRRPLSWAGVDRYPLQFVSGALFFFKGGRVDGDLGTKGQGQLGRREAATFF